MLSRKIVTLLITLFMSVLCCFSQQAPVKSGVIKGAVFDAEHHLPLASATGTIYKVGIDSTVVAYLFTSKDGSFQFNALAPNTDLRISINYIGYKAFTKNFKIISSENMINLGEILLAKKTVNLNEVIVSGERPPIVMHNDTLEINAEAFKTKENAVVEDLLKKVPGIIVWADGKITVNGKPVKQLLVEGKPFFGGDPVVAIRNLPKDAINKIRVYNKNSNQDSALNNSLVMDILLKKNSKRGYFGKVGVGIGTGKRYEADAVINHFSPKTQASLLLATNNTNKEAYDIASMLKQSVYKPGGNDNNAYQSNFFKNGLNKFTAGGLNVSSDISPELNTRGEYFMYSTVNETQKNLQSKTILAKGYLEQERNESASANSRSHKITGWAAKESKEYSFYLSPVFEWTGFRNSTTNKWFTTDSNRLRINDNLIVADADNDNKSLSISSEYTKKNLNKRPLHFKYFLSSNQYQNDNIYSTLFKTFLPTRVLRDSSLINRKFSSQGHVLSQSFYNEIGIPVFPGFFNRLHPTLVNNTDLTNRYSTRDVNDYDKILKAYTLRNTYLTNNTNYSLLQERPGIKLSDATTKNLPDRYSKSLSYSLLFEGQFLHQKNNSDKAFQIFDRNYFSFLPSFNLQYQHVKPGASSRTYAIRYYTETQVPSPEQLVPLLDSTNQSVLLIGNNQLHKQYKNEIKLSATFNKGGGALSLNLTWSWVKNRFGDSSYYDNSGRRLSYTTNINGFKYLSLDGNYIKSAKLFNKPLGLLFFNLISQTSSPYYVNGSLIRSTNQFLMFFGKSTYVLNDELQLNLDAGTTYYRTRYTSVDNTKITQYLLSTNISQMIQVSWPGNMVITSNFIYNTDQSSYANKITSLIWNAGVYYRILKKKNLEFKITGNDLLKQRTNTISSFNANMLSLGRVNNLQQFFLFSISYYPRHFGSKEVISN